MNPRSTPARLRSSIRWCAALLPVAFVAGAVATWIAGGYLAKPANAAIGDPPAGLPVEAVSFASTSGSELRGWFMPGRDARAAVAWMRARLPSERLGAIGESMGGAAALIGDTPLDVDALVVESVFPTIEDAIADRLEARLWRPGRWITPLLTLQLPWRLGVDARELAPIRGIGRVRCPILVLAGSSDRHTRVDESRRLFAAAPDPKELWIVDGAGHVDLHEFAGSAYEERVGAFLDRWLRSPSAA